MRSSKVIDDERVYLVRDILEAINHILKMIVKLRPDDEVHRADLSAFSPIGEEKRLASLVVNLVCLLLDANYFLSECVEATGVVADRTEKRHRLQHQFRRLQNDLAHLLHLWFEAAHLEQRDGLGGLCSFGR
jgi:hypothetical protein